MTNENQEKVFIVVDGSNFYHRLKESAEPKSRLLDFDYYRFIFWLAGNRIIAEKKYYIGTVRPKLDDIKGQSMRKNQQKLFTGLRKDGWKIEYGYILHTTGEYHEKGVDVHMAVDILVGAYEDLYDTLIVVSSDTDLIPALVKVRSMKKKVEYIGFSHKPSHALITHSDVRRLLTGDELQEFLTRKEK
jgi:uncharacterized LabA/DUF88 family protein